MTPHWLTLALLLAAPAASPPPDRAVAEGAITSARHAVEQARDEAQRTQAQKKLDEAEALFSQGQYPEAATAADSAWKLLSAGGGEKTHFEVQVADDGTTQVHSRSGQPVRVDAEGKTVAVGPGEALVVHKGHPPERTESQAADAALRSPTLLAPRDHQKVHYKGKLADPVLLSWARVEGASGYQLIVANAEKETAYETKVNGPSAKVPPLPPGKYRWSVWAVSAKGERSPVAERSFELVPDALKLEVQTSKWK